MKKIRTVLWITGIIVVLAIVWFKPQYAVEAAKAVMLVIGENQCLCE